jgi:hypothetical protein
MRGAHTMCGRPPSCEAILHDWHSDYAALMRACWLTKPEDRPDAECVVRKLTALLELLEEQEFAEILDEAFAADAAHPDVNS